jgi:chromatin remodeling complex protein RSC6
MTLLIIIKYKEIDLKFTLHIILSNMSESKSPPTNVSTPPVALDGSVAAPSPMDVVEGQFTTLFAGLNEVTSLTKSLQEELKGLHKSCRQIEKTSRQKKKRPQHPLLVSGELCKFLSTKKNSQMTKADVMKGVSAYIKTNNLQLTEDKRRFKPNKDLCKLFAMPLSAAKNMTFVEINKHVSPHLTKLEENA